MQIQKLGKYRFFTDKEIKKWVLKDKLSPKLVKKAKKFWEDIP